MSRRSTASGGHATQNFVLGERSLRAYFAGGNARFLDNAVANFSALQPNDELFDNASFYLAVAKTQLRKTSDSIKILADLRERTKGASTRLSPGLKSQISLQLAYAYIKTYKADGFQSAEEELDRLEREANESRNGELLLQTNAIQVFLYSVMAGRSDNESLRPKYATLAINLGNRLLISISPTSDSGPALRFEAFNALGIAWMRSGEAGWSGFGDREKSWAQAQSYYDQALEIIPNSLRVLQNLAQLRLSQAKQDFTSNKAVLLDQARQYLERSLEVSDQDQFPFSMLAKVAIESGDGEAALKYIHKGRFRNGAITDDKWAKLEIAAKALLRAR